MGQLPPRGGLFVCTTGRWCADLEAVLTSEDDAGWAKECSRHLRLCLLTLRLG